MYMGIAGLLLAVIGLAALLYPIYLDQSRKPRPSELYLISSMPA
jgi:hypothetical protein